MSLIDQAGIAARLYRQSIENNISWRAYLSKLSQSSNPDVAKKLSSFGALSHAAKGIVFAELYGLARGLQVSKEAKLCCTSIVSLSSSVDDIIDQEMSVAQERLQFCEEVFETLTKGSRHSGNTPHQEAVLTLAQDLHLRTRHYAAISEFYATSLQLKNAVIANLGERDPTKLLGLARIIGSCTSGLTNVYGVVDNRFSRELETPIQFYGEFGQLIDDLVDYKSDLAEGQNTFPTRCDLSFKEMKKTMLSEAEKSFERCLKSSKEEWKDYFRVFRKISLLVWNTPDWFVPKYKN